MKIGVVGNGVVGQATARAFLEHADVRCWDKEPVRRTHRLDKVLECDLIFVCLPTPQKKDSLECDLSAVEEFFSDVNRNAANDCNFVLRSTVPIGTTRWLEKQYDLDNLVHSPEFLTARCSFTDAQLPARNVVGYPGWNFKGGGTVEEYLKEFNEPREQCFRTLLQLYRTRFPGVPIHAMTSDESEAVKLFINGFFAVKVAYFNEVRCLADQLGLDWDRVMAGVLSDGRVAHAHTKVPGPDGKFGFGGTCLPKDLASLIHQMNLQSMEHHVCIGALTRNISDRERA